MKSTILLDNLKTFLELCRSGASAIEIQKLGAEMVQTITNSEGGVLSNEHLRTAFARTNERLQLEKRLNQLELELMQDYLDDQIQSMPP